MFYPWNRFHRHAIFESWCITFLTIQDGSRKIGYLPMKHFDQWQAGKLNAISLKILINKTGGGGSGWPGRPVATSQTIAAAYAASLYNRIVSGKMTNSLQTASVVLPNRYFRQEKNGVMEGGGGRAPQGKSSLSTFNNIPPFKNKKSTLTITPIINNHSNL